MSADTQDPLGDLRRFDVRPGDLFALTLAVRASDEEIGQLCERWRAVAGDARLIVLAPGMELTLYRPVEPAAAPAEAAATMQA